MQYEIMRQPAEGTRVRTRYGLATVSQVHGHGEQLTVVACETLRIHQVTRPADGWRVVAEDLESV
jgi:hypothetical protein